MIPAASGKTIAIVQRTAARCIPPGCFTIISAAGMIGRAASVGDKRTAGAASSAHSTKHQARGPDQSIMMRGNRIARQAIQDEAPSDLATSS